MVNYEFILGITKACKTRLSHSSRIFGDVRAHPMTKHSSLLTLVSHVLQREGGSKEVELSQDNPQSYLDVVFNQCICLIWGVWWYERGLISRIMNSLK